VPHMRNRAGPIADGRERQLQGGVFRRQGAALVYFLPHRLKQNPGAWPGFRVEQPLGSVPVRFLVGGCGEEAVHGASSIRPISADVS
jgi:hypothetical protein